MSEAWEQYISKPGATDDRELLTDECIRADLLDRIKMSAINLTAFLPLVALIVCLLIIAPYFIILYLWAWIIYFAILVFYVYKFAFSVDGYFRNKEKICIAKDKLVGHKIHYPWWTGSIIVFFLRWAWMYFSKYKSYHLPYTSYKWSENNQIFHLDMIDTYNNNDEFYVVLNKNGRIVMAYPCAAFRYDGEVSD